MDSAQLAAVAVALADERIWPLAGFLPFPDLFLGIVSSHGEDGHCDPLQVWFSSANRDDSITAGSPTGWLMSFVFIRTAWHGAGLLCFLELPPEIIYASAYLQFLERPMPRAGLDRTDSEAR